MSGRWDDKGVTPQEDKDPKVLINVEAKEPEKDEPDYGVYCIKCADPCNYVFKGNSYCSFHFRNIVNKIVDRDL